HGVASSYGRYRGLLSHRYLGSPYQTRPRGRSSRNLAEHSTAWLRRTAATAACSATDTGQRLIERG
ncbi:MAG TPA: hypothetical protein PKK40_07895, partial [Marmoricola sp.]|nr:hypothetical protein [Marmoricola sp.]